MAGILSALGRGNQQKDPMRESAALTTVYLLEQNQKFEQFMRQKVDDLESRVAAQQARLSTREEVEERELWAALESFEVPPDTAQTPGLAAADETVVGIVAEPVDELMAWDDDPGVEEPVYVGVTAAPEEIPDYLALMSGAVAEQTVPAGNEPEITLPVAADSLETEMAEFDEQNPIISGDQTGAVIEPEDEPGFTTEGDPPQAVPPAPQNGSSSWQDEETELPADDRENEVWSGQPYETFQINRPIAEAVEENWPELAIADEVELLGRQPTDDGVAEVEKTHVSPPTKTAESDVPSAHIASEMEKAWQTTLPDGRKGEWT
jgi:hypothetical protein